MQSPNLVPLREALERINNAGIHLSIGGLRGWIARNKGLAVKVGGRLAIPAEALDLILAGVPLDVVATHTQMRQAERRGCGDVHCAPSL